MNIVTYQVSGLSCNACVNRVKNALTPYAEQVEVTLKPPRATLQHPTKNLAELNAVLMPQNHYQLSEVSEDGEKLSLLKWFKK